MILGSADLVVPLVFFVVLAAFGLHVQRRRVMKLARCVRDFVQGMAAAAWEEVSYCCCLLVSLPSFLLDDYQTDKFMKCYRYVSPLLLPHQVSSYGDGNTCPWTARPQDGSI